MMLEKILLVDDDLPTNHLHQIILRKKGCANQVQVYQNASEALTFLERNEPDLILLDINMPKLNGWDFLDRYVATNWDKRGTRVIMLTTSLDPKDREKAMTYGVVVDLVNKPLTFELLDQILEKHFA